MAKIQDHKYQQEGKKHFQKDQQLKKQHYLFSKFRIHFGPFSFIFKVTHNRLIIIFGDHVFTQIYFSFSYERFLTVRFAE